MPLCIRTTARNIVNLSIGTTPTLLLARDPRRIAWILSQCLAPGLGQVVQQVFTPTSPTHWIPPPGVTTLLRVRVWGSGGNGTLVAGGVAGGGGGAGGYGEEDNVPVISGNYTITVDVGSGGAVSNVADPAGGDIAQANSGQNAVASVGGAGGTGSIGSIQTTGGNGANGILLVAGGGGGAAGPSGNGGNAAGITGGIGIDEGGNGGNGGTAMANPGNGFSIGGGGGGDGGTTVEGLGADGQVIIIWAMLETDAPFSVSWNKQLTLGNATWNFFGPTCGTVMVTVDEVGTQIREELWGIAAQAGTLVEITEILCDDPEYDNQG